MVFKGDVIGDCKHCGMEMRLTDGMCFDCMNRIEGNVATWTEIIKLELRVHELESCFRHTHVNNGLNDRYNDSCKQCGLDLMDTIHTRLTNQGG